MKVCTLASGSSGNCVWLSGEGGQVLVDCGISCRRISQSLARLGTSLDQVGAVFITHEHSDHISGLATLVKQRKIPVYASPGTTRELRRRIPFSLGILHDLEPGETAEAAGFTVTSFATSHDAIQPMGYSLTAGGRTAAVATDTGVVTDEVRRGVQGAHLLICEANYDPEWLALGPYPYLLKIRIQGRKGHLDNQSGAELARFGAEHGARTVVLAHLSAENNSPMLAMMAAKQALEGLEGVRLTVAPRGEMSEVFEV